MCKYKCDCGKSAEYFYNGNAYCVDCLCDEIDVMTSIPACAQCGVELPRKFQVDASGNHFCSRRCACDYNAFKILKTDKSESDVVTEHENK